LQPDLSPEQTAPELIGVGAKSIVDNAQRLGLEWTLRLATVLDGSNASAVSAVYDGDANNPIDMTSMIGTLLFGQRIYVIIVPPSGNFIVGRLGKYEARQTLTTTTASITFSAIPIGLRALSVKWRARSTNVAAIDETRMQVNGSSAAVYGSEHIQAVGGGAAGGTLITGATSMFVGTHASAGAAAGIFATGELLFTGWDLTATGLPLNWEAGAFTFNGVKQVGTGFFGGSSPYTSLTFFPLAGSWVADTDFQLEGWPS